MIRLAIALLSAVIICTTAVAHDSWIGRGKFRNHAGEWCCGAHDCALMDADAVDVRRNGYAVNGFGTVASPFAGTYRLFVREMVPHTEALPSMDGAYWRCHKSDKSRKCFFVPPPSI